MDRTHSSEHCDLGSLITDCVPVGQAMAQCRRDGGRTSRIASILLMSVVFQAGQDLIRTQVDLVVVPVSVRDKEGNPVSDLKRENFRLLEDGRPQEIRSVSFEDQPLSVAVLIESDLGPFFQHAKPVPFGQIFSDRDEVEVYAFDSEIERVLGFTNRRGDIEKAFWFAMEKSKHRPVPVSDRNLNGALSTAIGDLEKVSTERRKAIIVIGGGLYGERAAPSDTEERLSRNQIQVYGIKTGGHEFPIPVAPRLFRYYAERTGGDVCSVATPNEELKKVLKRIDEEVHQHYVISYVSNNAVPARQANALSRRIDVRVHRSGVGVSYRKTYLQFPQNE